MTCKKLLRNSTQAMVSTIVNRFISLILVISVNSRHTKTSLQIIYLHIYDDRRISPFTKRGSCFKNGAKGDIILKPT